MTSNVGGSTHVYVHNPLPLGGRSSLAVAPVQVLGLEGAWGGGAGKHRVAIHGGWWHTILWLCESAFMNSVVLDMAGDFCCTTA